MDVETNVTEKSDIVLEVPRHCDLDVETPRLTLAQTTGGNWSDAGFFNVSTNAPYRLNINPLNTLRNGENSVPVVVTTTRGGKSLLWHSVKYQRASPSLGM